MAERMQAGQAIVTGADWLGDRIEDGAAWLANLVRWFPVRLARFVGTALAGLSSLAEFGPSAVRAVRVDRRSVAPVLKASRRPGAILLLTLLLDALDLAGVPELFAFIWRLLTRTSPLTGAEIEAAASVLGENAVRYQDIRVAQGGVLKWVFKINDNRAFATFHTINLPEEGEHVRSNTKIVVHEIIHVYQYERAGSRYFAEALLGQHEAGYWYGEDAGLALALQQGRPLRSFNREQQAQIAEDYFVRLNKQADITAYEPFIRQLRDGRV